MVYAEKKFVAEIRDTTDHQSTEDESAAFTIDTDELHPGDKFTKFDSVAIHLENTHDQGFDVDIQTDAHDGDFTNAVTENTTSMSADGDAARVTLDGPIGRLRFAFRTGALGSAPTSGQIRCWVYATGPAFR